MKADNTMVLVNLTSSGNLLQKPNGSPPGFLKELKSQVAELLMPIHKPINDLKHSPI